MRTPFRYKIDCPESQNMMGSETAVVVYSWLTNKREKALAAITVKVATSVSLKAKAQRATALFWLFSVV